jgi:ubiquinone/menaquinone biosynthesis C-methylase UbiE
VTRAKSGNEKTGIAPGYLHGFTPDEQARLYHQARFWAPSIFKNVPFQNSRHVLEVGCGVGAQTEILLERFPQISIKGVDASPTQITQARSHLTQSPNASRVQFLEGDALHLPFADNTFDSAFLCWFLEHVQTPVEILEEVRRVLQTGGVIFCNEVLNATFYIHPYSPATLKYWFEFNDHQWTLKGDPFIGGKLANYLLKAGFQNIQTQVVTQHHDNRTPKARADFIEYWTHLLLSGAPALIQAGRVTSEQVEEMRQEMHKLKSDPDSVIFYSFVQAIAQSL